MYFLLGVVVGWLSIPCLWVSFVVWSQLVQPQAGGGHDGDL